MERYLFTPDGYRCIGEDGSILHQSERHEDLFQFVDKDETPLYALLKEYIDESIDFKKRRPAKQNDRKYEIQSNMQMLLKSLHPFCTSAYLDKEIAIYFNAILADQCIRERNTDNIATDVSITEYKAMLGSLFPQGIGLHGSIECDDYYADFQRKLTDEADTHEASTPFADIHKSKLMIKDYLYWVLDSDAAPFSDLPFAQRQYVYNAYHHPEARCIANTEVEYYLGSPEGVRLDGSYQSVQSGSLLTLQLPDGRCMAEAVQGITSNKDYAGIAPEAKENLKQMIEEAKKSVILDEYCAIYGIRDLFTLLFIECERMYEAKVSIRRCECCGHYFIASKRMYKYCERMIDETTLQTCRDVGAKESQKKKIRNDRMYSLYNRAYRTRHAHIKAGHITKPEFDAWAAEAKRRMEEAIADPSLADDYAAWLKN